MDTFCIFSTQEVRERSFLLFPNCLIILSVNANACGYRFEVNFDSLLFLHIYYIVYDMILCDVFVIAVSVLKQVWLNCLWGVKITFVLFNFQLVFINFVCVQIFIIWRPTNIPYLNVLSYIFNFLHLMPLMSLLTVCNEIMHICYLLLTSAMPYQVNDQITWFSSPFWLTLYRYTVRRNLIRCLSDNS